MLEISIARLVLQTVRPVQDLPLAHAFPVTRKAAEVLLCRVPVARQILIHMQEICRAEVAQ